MLKLMEGLDDHDDVKQVFANFDIAEDELLAGVGAS
jgi:transcriptional/translational regulatory protein YebC/TACO1